MQKPHRVWSPAKPTPAAGRSPRSIVVIVEHTAGDEFQRSSSDDAGQAHGDQPSQIEATETESAMRFFVVDPDAGPIAGVVIKMRGADGRVFDTGETDSVGYAEVVVPAGQRYDIEYLSLGRRTTSAQVEVPSGPARTSG